jgi:hypothetical protein
VIELVGTSENSVEEAINRAIERAHQTPRSSSINLGENIGFLSSLGTIRLGVRHRGGRRSWFRCLSSTSCTTRARANPAMASARGLPHMSRALLVERLRRLARSHALPTARRWTYACALARTRAKA